MAVNTMTFNQLATVLADIVGQAAGQTVHAPIDTYEFVSVGKVGLEAGYDALATAISTVLSKTIFSIRPYDAIFANLEMDDARYGNMVRKLSVIDGALEDDDRIQLVDGSSIDPWKVNKPKVFQENWYGINVYQKSITIYRDQLDTAFSGPAEFQQFISMIMQNVQDQLEQCREDASRMTLVNLIGGTIQAAAAGSVIHLKTEFCADKLGLDPTDPSDAATIAALNIYDPQYFSEFAKYAFARMVKASKALRERTVLYHQNPTAASPVSGYIYRHTPVDRQRLYLLSPFFDDVDASVLSGVYNDKYLQLLPHEFTTYWQDVQDPYNIDVDASYMDTDGTIAHGAVNQDGVLGVLMDEEAAAINMVNEWSAPSPFNPRGGYTNIYWHRSIRYCNSFTENCVVFLLD